MKWIPARQVEMLMNTVKTKNIKYRPGKCASVKILMNTLKTNMYKNTGQASVPMFIATLWKANTFPTWGFVSTVSCVICYTVPYIICYNNVSCVICYSVSCTICYHCACLTSSAGTSLDKSALKAGVCVGRNRNGNRNGNGNGNTYIFEAKPVLGWTTRWLHRYTTSSWILRMSLISTIILVIKMPWLARFPNPLMQLGSLTTTCLARWRVWCWPGSSRSGRDCGAKEIIKYIYTICHIWQCSVIISGSYETTQWLIDQSIIGSIFR